jgi:hypothetical protein
LWSWLDEGLVPRALGSGAGATSVGDTGKRQAFRSIEFRCSEVGHLRRATLPPRTPTAHDRVIVMLVSIEAREGVCPERRVRLVSVLACGPSASGRWSGIPSVQVGRRGAITKNWRKFESVFGHPSTHRSFVTVMISSRPCRCGASRDSSGNRRCSDRGGSSGRIGWRRYDFCVGGSRQPSALKCMSAPGSDVSRGTTNGGR